ncbi:MAG: 2-oxoacid:acceptor oxidoreductase subunit alpha [Thermodesulfobacteriota bacterium]
MDITIRIGGEAGQGLQFIGSVLARIFSRNGLHVFSHQDYMSRIRGGHNFYQIRVADHPVRASKNRIDILLALDENTILVHRDNLRAAGVIIHDSAMTGQEHDEADFLHIPFLEMTEKAGVTRQMANAAAIGAILGVLGLDLDLFPETIRDFLANQGNEVVASNLAIAQMGWEYSHSNGWPESLKFSPANRKGLMLINGNQAVGFGALVSGCRFLSAYPMTPSTGIMIYLAGKAEEYKIIVEQAEDEIAAINMALGASFGGVRAMTTTSGGGFALMAEGLSLAGMAELPLVIAEVQRPGPATGLPTRTEQGDLLFVLHCGHGEFPKVLFTPGTPGQAISLTNKAFELAEKYQVQVIIQSDQFLADSEWTYEETHDCFLNYNDYRDRSENSGEEEYKRFALTENGVSPLAVPGLSTRLVVVDSDEHDEEGHIIEDSETRNKMVAKRLLRKMPLLQEEIAPPEYYGHDNPTLLLVGYGSTYGIMHEAVDELADEVNIALLHFSEVWPFPVAKDYDFMAAVSRAELAVCVENNATGQFARLIRAETGFLFKASIRKYDGRPFLLEPFLGEVDELLGQV